jgi:hypothetical protein
MRNRKKLPSNYPIYYELGEQTVDSWNLGEDNALIEFEYPIMTKIARKKKKK